ncbi:MAG: AAA family ATPase [Muribaculaceae bacterium]|nr:AAA family ATPase [Muribaculaceae bacterium]
MRENIKYPVGDQSFESIRTDGYLYIDKTMYIEKLLNGSKYIFLSRPRRFGKSLFLSMLKCFFEGRKELFKGLYADTMQWDWATYPIFHLDLNNQKYRNDTDLEVVIEDFLINLEKKYCVTPPQTNHSVRLANLMKAAFEATGKKVVILVDEYDKPLVNNIHDRERFETYRDKLSALYSNFKSSADFIRLVFLTGVSRFGKLSVFSSLNNLSDISFDEAYASICGITEQELRAYFKPGFEAFVEKEKITSEELFLRLKKWYDGYHFSIDCTDIYNPFSILCAFDKLRFRNYWIASGTPTLLVEQLIKTETNLEELIHTVCPQSELEGLDVDNIIPVALLYQTGYLTIKDYDAGDDIFTLGIPNEEVKRGFFEFILPYYTNIGRKNPRILIIELRKMLEAGEVENLKNNPIIS